MYCWGCELAASTMAGACVVRKLKATFARDILFSLRALEDKPLSLRRKETGSRKVYVTEEPLSKDAETSAAGHRRECKKD